jgi:hypothetical protein
MARKPEPTSPLDMHHIAWRWLDETIKGGQYNKTDMDRFLKPLCKLLARVRDDGRKLGRVELATELEEKLYFERNH